MKLAGCISQTGAAQRRSSGHLAVIAACRAVRVADASCAVEAGSGTTVDRVEMNGVCITNRGNLAELRRQCQGVCYSCCTRGCSCGRGIVFCRETCLLSFNRLSQS